MIQLSRFIILAISVWALSSCEKVIDIELNEEDRQIVIEARLRSGDHPFEVKINKTTGYFSSETPIQVMNAFVELKDEDGNTYSIPHVGEGRYVKQINAEENKQYTLTVVAEGQTYKASSFMKSPVPLLGLASTYEEETSNTEAHYRVKYNFTDPADQENWYRIRNYVDGVEQREVEDLVVLSDENFNGQNRTRTLRNGRYYPGEEVTIELVHIEEAAFEYYSSLQDIVGGGFSAGVAAPGNPTTNWSDKALGSFITFSSDQQSIVIPG
ncbi:DUF4249 domain-containing protein [bacterium SCSIO 12643]|nr:DUF4249 domain-containing protein [bacterium SCSIO 12643]